METTENLKDTVDAFPTAAPSGRNFFEGKDETIARELGEMYWSTPERAYSNFLHAYAALFAIPPFVREALARQPSRFDRDQLPHTVATTSGFILDAFGFDRRTNRRRDVIYSPAPTIRASHARRIDHTGRTVKERISDAAMIYFATHLIRAAEEKVASDTRHFSYFRTFFRDAGYRFPEHPEESLKFCEWIDEELAHNEFSHLQENILYASEVLDADVTQISVKEFLLPRSAGYWISGG